MKEKLEEFGRLEVDVSLKNYNTYKIDTSAKYVLHPKDIDNLISFLHYDKENKIEFIVLGNGSNVILSDTSYPSVIIKLDMMNKIKYENMLFASNKYKNSGKSINKYKNDIDIIKNKILFLNNSEWKELWFESCNMLYLF